MLQDLLKLANQKINDANDLSLLQLVKVELLGKNGLVIQQMQQLKTLSDEARKEFGKEINNVKNEIQELINKKEGLLKDIALKIRLEKEHMDLTIPARRGYSGKIHPITKTINELQDILAHFGFKVEQGPNIETDWHNFSALNIDENHPARQMHDTFYLKGMEASSKNNMLLRTHTSPVQIRTMLKGQPPFRFIAPGRTYRADSDMTHTPMFHQIEGVLVDRDVHMGHLKYIIHELIKTFFADRDIDIRFRPSFFPFTEPSAEVDIRIKPQEKWLEVLGCGMVHPNVLNSGGINPDEYTAFAFGLGVERFAMLKYNIPDLRQFFEGDIRWLQHYGFYS